MRRKHITKALVVYTSLAHGNTEKVAKAMAEVIQADLVKTVEITPKIVARYDLVGFGSGIYDGQHHAGVFELVAGLSESAGKKAFVFSTSGYGKTKPNQKLANLLAAKGFKVVGNFACKGFDTAGINRLYGGAAKGRPNGGDLKAARTFARSLV